MDFDYYSEWKKADQDSSSLDTPDTEEPAGRYLKLSSAADQESLEELSYPSLEYFHWLRILNRCDHADGCGSGPVSR